MRLNISNILTNKLILTKEIYWSVSKLNSITSRCPILQYPSRDKDRRVVSGLRIKCTAVVSVFCDEVHEEERPLLSIYALMVGPRHSWIESTADRSTRGPRCLLLPPLRRSITFEYSWICMTRGGRPRKNLRPWQSDVSRTATAFARTSTRARASERGLTIAEDNRNWRAPRDLATLLERISVREESWYRHL